MVWQNALVSSSNHWITDFVTNLRNYSSSSDKPYSNQTRLQLVKVNRYPPLDIVNIYKVFKDKRNRLHYFSLSQPETIEFFVEIKNLWKVENYLECIDHPNYRVRRIFLNTDFDLANQEYLYCLPQMSWIFDLETGDYDHWMIDYVLRYKDPSEAELVPEHYLECYEVTEYPPLDIVEIYRVYRHVNGTYNYFSLSDSDTLADFMYEKNIDSRTIEVLRHKEYPYHTVVRMKIENNANLFCSPRVLML